MKSSVGSDELSHMHRRAAHGGGHVVVRHRDGRDVRGGSAQGSHGRSRGFNHAPDLRQVSEERRAKRPVALPREHVGIQQLPSLARSDACAEARPRLDEPFRYQDFDRFAKRRAAYRQPARPGEGVAGLNLAAEDLAAQTLHEATMQRGTRHGSPMVILFAPS